MQMHAFCMYIVGNYLRVTKNIHSLEMDTIDSKQCFGH